jgi:hypothetical protein
MSMSPVVSTPHLAREAFFSADMPEEKVRGYYSRLQDESYRAYLDMLGLGLPDPKRVKSPILVLGAADDTIIAAGDVQATAQAYGVQAQFFAGMSHDMMLERGWQAVADRIIGWLSEKGL